MGLDVGSFVCAVFGVGEIGSVKEPKQLAVVWFGVVHKFMMCCDGIIVSDREDIMYPSCMADGPEPIGARHIFVIDKCSGHG